MELCELTISQARQGLEKKEFSSLELTGSFLAKIKSKDKKISAFLTLTEDLALSQAKEIDRLISKGGKIPVLAGIPLAVKDNILIEGIKTTCASGILKNYIAPYDASVIKKLKGAGAIILGKTNLDEFAMGSSTEYSAFFPTKNPWDLERVPGGSSGGSAAAVAADMCCYALGSDTGGSVRQPASFCGLVGLKPTYGAVSRCGLIAFASSLDQIGCLTKTAADAQIVFEAIKGKDPMDSTSVEISETRVSVKASELKIGLPKEYFVKGLEPGVEKVVRKAIKRLEEAGAKIEEITLPNTRYLIPVYYLICTSEASANLARYDGVRYGLAKVFGPEVKRRIMLGVFALSAGYYDAYYLKAQKVRTLIIEDFKRAFEKVEAILTPTAPSPAFKLGEKKSDPLEMYLNDIFTVSANLAGLPAVSAPAGFSGKLPVGVQLIGRPFEENKILEIAKIFQKNG